MRRVWVVLSLAALCACGSAKPSAGDDVSVPAPPYGVVYIPGQHVRLDTLAREMRFGTPPAGGVLLSETTYATPGPSGDPLAFYRAEMPKQGWALERDEPPGANDDALLVFSRGNGKWYAYIAETVYIGAANDVPRGIPPGGYFLDVAVVEQPG